MQCSLMGIDLYASYHSCTTILVEGHEGDVKKPTTHAQEPRDEVNTVHVDTELLSLW